MSCGGQETTHGIAPIWLNLHLAISSKWLPKIFIKIFKEYLRAKFQAPANVPTLCIHRYLKFIMATYENTLLCIKEGCQEKFMLWICFLKPVGGMGRKSIMSQYRGINFAGGVSCFETYCSRT